MATEDSVHLVKRTARSLIAKTKAIEKYFEGRVSEDDVKFVPRELTEKDIVDLFGKLLKNGEEMPIDASEFQCENSEFKRSSYFYLPSDGTIDLLSSENCQPNEVFVSNDPKQIVLSDFNGEPLWTIPVSNPPESITHTPDGYLLMSVFKQREIRGIRQTDPNLKTFLSVKPLCPLGIYCESDGTILVCLVEKFDFTPNPNSHRLVRRYARQGTVMNSIERYMGKRIYSCPFRVAGGFCKRVHVIDITSANGGKIVVTTQEGKPVFSFDNGGIESFCPTALCVDTKGYLFVTERHSKSIFTLDNNGILVQKLDIFRTLQPTSLSVCYGHKIAVGLNNNQVSIYEPYYMPPVYEEACVENGKSAVSAL